MCVSCSCPSDAFLATSRRLDACPGASLSRDYAGDLLRLSMFVAKAREIDLQLPCQTLQVLLLVAGKRGITQRELGEVTGLAPASISRNLNALSAEHRNGRPGYGLVAQAPSRFDARAFDAYLTAHGRDAVRRLLRAATGEAADTFSPPTVR